MTTPEQEAWLNNRSRINQRVTNGEVLLSSLRDHRDLNKVLWDDFRKVYDIPLGSCRKAVRWGWDHDEGTKTLQGIVLAALRGDDLKEEDFL